MREAIAAATLTIASLTAQQQLVDLPRKPLLPEIDAQIYDADVGDLDGDGAVDVVLATESGLRILLQRQGRFVDATQADLLVPFNQAVIGDVDGDGDLDIIANKWTLVVLANTGNARFTDITRSAFPPFGIIGLHGLQLADLDGDSDLDLYVERFGFSPDQVWANDGTGFYQQRSTLPVITWDQGVALFDRDGDADLDALVVASRDMRLFDNDGTGAFTDVTSSALPAGNYDYRFVTAGDVDGDGDIDFVAGQDTTELFTNGGNGVFTRTAVRIPAQPHWDGRLVDQNGDGDLDFLSAGPPRLFDNDGTGAFTEVTATRIVGTMPAADRIVPFDYDGDGDSDYLLQWLGGVEIYVDDGIRVVDATSRRIPAGSFGYGGRFVDIDADGDRDLIVAAVDGLEIHVNDGSGRLSEQSAARVPDNAPVGGLAVGDIDGDGDEDLVAPFGVRLNDGAGNFALVPDPSLLIAGAVELADVDGDGDLDAVFAWSPTHIFTLWLNDGTGTFTDATAGRVPPRGGTASGDVSVLDVDSDGDPDLVVAVFGGPNLLARNDGSGTFTASPLPGPTGAYGAVDSGDLDGDGDLDCVFGASFVGPVRALMLLGDGAGGFAVAPPGTWSPVDAAHGAVELADIDRDGDLDLICGGDDPPPHRPPYLYLNTPAGFVESSATRAAFAPARILAIVAGDLDGDRDVEVFVTGHDGHHRIYGNHHRQLISPAFVRRGGTLELEVVAEPGYATIDRAALMLLSDRLAATPLVLPFGTLFLPATGLLTFGDGTVVPRATGRATVRIAVPNVPNLRGVALFLQSAIYDPANPFVDLTLTGWVTEVVQ